MEPLHLNWSEMARSLSSPILDVLDSFERSRHDLRESTMRGYLAGIWRFAVFTGSQNGLEVPRSRKDARPILMTITPAALTLENANRYIDSLVRRKRKTTAHHDGRALAIFSEWCVEARIFPADPLAGFKVPKQPNNRRRPFQDEDVPLIRKAARDSDMGERDETIVVVAIACGLRKDELRNLQYPEDVDLPGRVLYVRDRAAKTDASIRRVVMDDEIVAMLDEYIDEWRPSRQPGALFLNNHGDGLTYGGFASIFRRLKRKLPREMDFKLHRARNTAITNWLRNGNDLHTTMKLAGHKSPKVTERYAGEFTDDELRKLVRPSFTAIYGKRSA
ncbi:MAG: site-specific integrase [Chloroflexi bacterium]|nr:MAG: site-specific integrase [Chloroflexota bacterium]